jgi:2',3'-cyclic-nucleotide 2'-phosphodiesterase (5'-nucleotidase family)
MKLWLRILQINDVYELENMASLATMARQEAQQHCLNHQQPPDHVLFVLAGDFVGPSLLSSLDKATSMVDCLNAVGITHVCLGNHETDIPMTALGARIRQANFCWINSNMPSLNEILGVDMPAYDIITVRSKTDPTITKRVGLLGLVTNDPSLYRPGSFGDATIDPVLPTTRKLLEQLKISSNVDLIVPMTHQSMAEDRDFCRIFGAQFPIVLGGHDHVPFDETINGSRIYKTGMDAHMAGIIDIIWNNCTDEQSVEIVSPVEITAKLVRTADYPPDPDVAQRVASHKKLLTELDQARLFRVGAWMDTRIRKSHEKSLVFSTRNNRLRPSTGSTALATILRMGLRCPCAIINAGSIRGNKDYSDDTFFTWSDLMTEIPFPTTMTTCYLPGRVLEATITHSRVGSREDPPVPRGGYLHTCTNIVYNDDKRCIESIQGEPFHPDQVYLTALPDQFFLGIDNHVPLLEWAETQECIQQDASIPAKILIVEVFSTLLWLQLGSFADIDTDEDGRITRNDVSNRIQALCGEQIAELVVDNVMAVADPAGMGEIRPLEMMVVYLSATDLLDHISDEEESNALRQTVVQVTGYDAHDPRVEKLMERVRDVVDHSKDGFFQRNEIRQSTGKLRRQTLLS